MKRNILYILIFLSVFSLKAVAQKTTLEWGDQGNGTYINPILNADYSDPDIIRVGKKYYMICSDFHYMGMQVLESEDMVNWQIISQIYSRLEHQDWDNNRRYGAGAWAPSLRYHDRKFWMYVCTPHEGLLMSQAEDPRGPWSPLHVVHAAEKWEDPCPIWDEDGKAYLGRSQWGGGPIIVHEMTADGKKLLDNGVTIYNGPVAEGVKFYKLNGYYYISIPEGGVSTGWQTVLRSKNIYGPYEKKIVLEQGGTSINGPHQGALVDTPDGEWWFYHFQSFDPLGRVVHLQPVYWKEDWPMIGVDVDMNGIGEPVYVWKKPKIQVASLPGLPQTDDDFSSCKLGVQWQFNHNPDWNYISLEERKGWLTIRAQQASRLSEARNMLTQKTMGYESEAETYVVLKAMANGMRAGLFCIGNIFKSIGVLQESGKRYIYTEEDGNVKKINPVNTDKIYFKIHIDARNNLHQLYYSVNQKDYIACDKEYSLQSGSWKGARVGLYAYNTQNSEGKVFFDWFTYRTIK